MNWHEYFFDLIEAVAKKSKDPSIKVGCVIVGKNNQILSTGFNGFPMGVAEKSERYENREIKLQFTEHAERNAIFLAARSGVSLEGSTIYLPWFPCEACARAIIQSGVARVYVDGRKWDPMHPTEADIRWKNSFKASSRMLLESGVIIDRIIPGGSVQRIMFPIDYD